MKKPAPVLAYRNFKLPAEKRVKGLLKRMTLEDDWGQFEQSYL